MASVEKLVAQLERDPANVRFSELHRICLHFFGAPRQGGTSHAVFRMPWPGDPLGSTFRTARGKAKPYRVRQVLAAIAKLQGKTK